MHVKVDLRCALYLAGGFPKDSPMVSHGSNRVPRGSLTFPQGSPMFPQGCHRVPHVPEGLHDAVLHDTGVEFMPW